MSLSKKTRFEVFKRDSFTCQYCGNNPPVVVLEVDHIVPVSRGGEDVIDNLITSCFDCNRGKSDRELTCLPQTTVEKTVQLIEKEEQYKAYKKVIAAIKKREKKEIDEIDAIYTSYFPDWCLNDRFKNGSLTKFIKLLGYSAIESAMHTACSRIRDDSKAVKYFCGICWNMINNKSNG